VCGKRKRNRKEKREKIGEESGSTHGKQCKHLENVDSAWDQRQLPQDLVSFFNSFIWVFSIGQRLLESPRHV
jgi:hypothetical protein